VRKTRKPGKPIPAEAIARLAERERDVSRYFTNRERVMKPIEPVRGANVDFSATMLKEIGRGRRTVKCQPAGCNQDPASTGVRPALPGRGISAEAG
jgi:hypothetical protein